MIKKIAKGFVVVLVFFVPFGLLYLTASFIGLSFDASMWQEDGRMLVGVFGFFGGIVCAFVTALALFYPKAFK